MPVDHSDISYSEHELAIECRALEFLQSEILVDCRKMVTLESAIHLLGNTKTPLSAVQVQALGVIASDCGATMGHARSGLGIESYGGEHGSQLVSITLEDFKEVAKKAWEHMKALWAKVVAFIKKAIQSIQLFLTSKAAKTKMVEDAIEKSHKTFSHVTIRVTDSELEFINKGANNYPFKAPDLDLFLSAIKAFNLVLKPGRSGAEYAAAATGLDKVISILAQQKKINGEASKSAAQPFGVTVSVEPTSGSSSASHSLYDKLRSTIQSIDCSYYNHFSGSSESKKERSIPTIDMRRRAGEWSTTQQNIATYMKKLNDYFDDFNDVASDSLDQIGQEDKYNDTLDGGEPHERPLSLIGNLIVDLSGRCTKIVTEVIHANGDAVRHSNDLLYHAYMDLSAQKAAASMYDPRLHPDDRKKSSSDYK